MSRPALRALVPVAGGAAVLVAVVWRVGRGPFVAGLDAVTVPALAAAVALGSVATVCCSWRWVLVARNLGLGLPLVAAVPAYYRSQFLNLALPGGVLGDVHRAAGHARESGDLGRCLRAVVWERTAGQAVQVVLSALVLLVCPSPVRTSLPPAAVAAGGAVVAVLALRRRLARRAPRVPGALRAAAADGRRALLVPGTAVGIVATSAVVVAAHLATFLVAARAAGSTTSALRMLPLGTLVLLAMALPLSVGGWGAREGVAAPLFAAAGLGAGQGVAVTTTYAVLALAATLPGALVLLAPALRLVPALRPVHLVQGTVPAPRLEGVGHG